MTDGDTATSDLSLVQLVSVTAAGNFDQGLQPSTTPQLAMRAQRTYASANLTSRSGIISFLNLKYPQILGASAVITGDREMLRAGQNPLGLAEGAIDVFVKSNPYYSVGEAVIPLTYDLNTQTWVGRVALPVIPAFFSWKSGIFQVNNFQNERGVNRIYAKSLHPYVDNLGISYSAYEALGIRITDTSPLDFQASYVGDVGVIASDGSTLLIQGEYASDVFNTGSERSIVMRFDSVTTSQGLPAVQVNLKDLISGEVDSVFFVANDSSKPTFGVVDKTTHGYTHMLNGLDVSLIPASGLFDPMSTVGLSYQLNFRGRTANFTFNYYYDPFLVQVNSILQNPDYKPVNVSCVARSCIVCRITDFVVHYRITYGTRVDQSSARQAIANYVNQLIYPDVYEESRIGSIIQMYGARSLSHVDKHGQFYPSLAGTYVDFNQIETTVPRFTTTTLVPPVNDAGFGPRNVTYILNPQDITFNGLTQ